MGLFARSFDKPGKGIDPNAPQKRSFFRFMDILNRKMSHLMRVNLIYSLTLIPTFIMVFFLVGIISSRILSIPNLESMVQNIASNYAASIGEAGMAEEYFLKTLAGLDVFFRFVLSYLFVILWGMGPATAGATYVWRNFAREEHAWVWNDFKDALKSNFKQSAAVFFIDILAFFLFYITITVYSKMTGWMGLLQYVSWMVLAIYTMMHFYLYPMMVTFRLSLKELYHNALLFTLGKLPSNLLVLGILLLTHLGSLFLAIRFGGNFFLLFALGILLLEILILLSFSGLLINFNTYPKMKKYMFCNESEEGKETTELIF